MACLCLCDRSPVDVVRAFSEACLSPQLRDDVIPAIISSPARARACFDALVSLLHTTSADIDGGQAVCDTMRAWAARVMWTLCRFLKRSEVMLVRLKLVTVC